MADSPNPNPLASYLRGLARGLGPDLLGGPVDLARDGLNLGIAGAGYAGHKLGLLKEPLPLIEPGAVGDSDWWAKLTNVSDDGSGQYTAGRLTPLATVGVKAAGEGAKRLVNAMVSRSAPSRSGPLPSAKSQEGAIRVGGREDLFASHDTKLEKLASTQNRAGTVELTAPSFAVTREGVPANFSGGGTGSIQLIPKVGAFDPATSASTLFNRDAYTARWHQFPSSPMAKLEASATMPLTERYLSTSEMFKAINEGKLDVSKGLIFNQPVGDELAAAFANLAKKDPTRITALKNSYLNIGKEPPDEILNSPAWKQDYNDFKKVHHFKDLIEIPGEVANKSTAAAKRLADRLFTPGAGKEGAGREGPTPVIPGEKLSKKRFDGGIAGSVSQDVAIKASPAFRSFSEYERSPRGAGLLTKGAEKANYNLLEEKIVDQAFARYIKHPDTLFAGDRTATDLANIALQSKIRQDPQEYRNNMLDFYAVEHDIPADPVKLLYQDPKALDTVLEDVQKGYARLPSEYGELKVHGQVPVNQENFAGAILRKPESRTWNNAPVTKPGLDEKEERVLQALIDRGVPVASLLDTYSNESAARLADILQKQTGAARKTRMFER